jgi:nicotinamidase/pyrazinamidase
MPTYDERTALVVTDVQNDFGDPAGGLYVRGGEEIVPVVNGEIARAASAGALIVYSQDWHPEVTPHFEKDGGIWPVHCVMGTWGAEPHPDLDVAGEIVQKGSDGRDGYSGFSVRDPESGEEEATRLDAMLREAGIRKVVVAGLALDYCVKETALDAAGHGYTTTVLSELTRAVDLEEGDGERAMKAIAAAGATVD